MSIYELRTVCIRPVMPPKPEAKIRVPLSEAYYADLIANEAKAVRARFRKECGNLTAGASGHEMNTKRKAEADARRDVLAQRALDLLAAVEMSSTEMCRHFEVSENQMRNALGLLRATGRATFIRTGARTVWKWMAAE